MLQMQRWFRRRNWSALQAQINPHSFSERAEYVVWRDCAGKSHGAAALVMNPAGLFRTCLRLGSSGASSLAEDRARWLRGVAWRLKNCVLARNSAHAIRYRSTRSLAVEVPVFIDSSRWWKTCRSSYGVACIEWRWVRSFTRMSKKEANSLVVYGVESPAFFATTGNGQNGQWIGWANQWRITPRPARIWER